MLASSSVPLASAPHEPQQTLVEDELHGQKALAGLELDDDAAVQFLIHLRLRHNPYQPLCKKVIQFDAFAALYAA